MNARQVESLLKQGLGYIHIADQLGTTEREVSAFVSDKLPELARTVGRIPSLVANKQLMSRINSIGAKAVAAEDGVSLSAVYRAKYRFEKNGE
jgi:transcriptional regulator